jgi:hypothetical protein
MRFYDHWYKEIWWWIQENKRNVIDFVVGILIITAFVLSCMYFNA